MGQGIPILTSEGFLGQRLIVDDYFVAGENLDAGDVVAYGSAAAYKTDADVGGNRHPRQVIGIVYAAPDDVVGSTRRADQGELVPVVVAGVARTKADGSIACGDPVVAGSATGRVKSDTTPAAGQMVGKALNDASDGGDVYVLVSLG